MSDDKPIIVIKKKGGHGGHHGGAWKVAFADFMTAMMAFFLVMWLVGTADSATRQNIAQYFRQPGLFDSGSGTPLLIGEGGILKDAYVPPHPADTNKYRGKGDDPQQAKSGSDLDDLDRKITIRGDNAASFFHSREEPDEPDPEKIPTYPKIPDGVEFKEEGEIATFQELIQDIKHKIQTIPELEDELGDLEVKLESDGMVIEIMDTDDKSMFHSSSAIILPQAEQAFLKIADLLSEFPNSIDIIGHTDAKPFSKRRNQYSNWELSADRANAARRILQTAGVDRNRILSVVGRADKDLKTPSDPLGHQNRRISLKMRFSKEKVIGASGLPSALEKLRAVKEQIETPLKHSSESSSTESKEPSPAESKTGSKVTMKKKPKKTSRKKKKGTVSLPEDTTPTASPKKNEKDKIFGDNPVFGPPPIFSDY
jgi:chemotaxis protein MotB